MRCTIRFFSRRARLRPSYRHRSGPQSAQAPGGAIAGLRQGRAVSRQRGRGFRGRDHGTRPRRARAKRLFVGSSGLTCPVADRSP
jgi:hypothetical protein